PKYNKDYGVTGSKEAYEKATPEQIQATKNALQPNSDNIIIEKGKIIAKLRNESEKWEDDVPSYANDYSESELVINVFSKTKLQKY
ncbi:5838_t:CDS:2, partial [Funneliformis mosseae]